MRSQVGVALLSVAAGVIVWAVTTALDVLDLLWRIVIALAIAALFGLIATLFLKRSSTDARRRVASNIKSRGNVRISDIGVRASGTSSDADIASDIRSNGDVEISKIQDESK